MVYILYDKPIAMEDMGFLASEIETEYVELYPDLRCDSIKKVATFAKSAFKRLKNGDTVVCWYDFMGVIIWWLSKFCSKQITIVALNILLKDKNSVKNNIARFLYKEALKTKNFTSTVTTNAYGNRLNQRLNLDASYYLLHDPYHSSFYVDYAGKQEANTVFCGGRNGRDWDLMIRLANALLDVDFSFIMSSVDFDNNKLLLSKNVKVKTDVSYKEFIETMCSSTIVALPLNTWAPAGLTVLFQAVANNKLVLTTDTVSTNEYLSVTPNLLCTTEDDWENKILHYLQNITERNKQSEMLKRNIEQLCSDKTYSQTINRILLEVRGE